MKSFSNPTTSAPITTIEPPNLLTIRKQIQDQNPNLTPLQATEQARIQLDEQKKQADILAAKTYQNTGIKTLDAAEQKVFDERNKAISDQMKSYTLAQADYNKNKNYYTNFDATNTTFNNIVKDTQTALAQSGSNALSDAQVQLIAQKNGVTPDQVTNPLNVYKGLQMTDEGKQVLGVSDRENQLTDLQTQTERAKQDAATNLTRTQTNIQQQIDDTNKQLQRSVDWATASGAWSGAAKSSGYGQGIQNIQSDANTIISRLQDQLSYANTDTATHVGRIQQDFETNMTRMKTSLDTDINKLKFDTGLQLNGLSEKYGTGSKELLKALSTIEDQFHQKSLETFNSYIASVK